MSLRCIVIEVRNTLQCANVFLQFDQSLTETEFLKINIDSKTIRCKEYSTETCIPVSNHFVIDALSLSNLVVEECNASFRIRLEPTTTTTPLNNSFYEIKTNDINLLQYKDQQPNFSVLETLEILCGNCNGILGYQKFQRILEFPSCSVDLGDFFCHHGPNFEHVLVPQMTDIFYGFQCIIVNTDIIRDKTKEKDEHLYCKRCLKYLGTTFLNSKASKLWTDSIKGRKENSTVFDIFPSDQSTIICQLLKKIIKESGIGVELTQQMQFSKILLEATFPNRIKKYLMLNILEKNLEILRNVTPLAHGSLNNNNVLDVKLDKCKCFKVLYKYENEQDNELPLLTFWKNDFSVNSMKISAQLLTTLIEELEINANILPEVYRCSNGFLLSYVFY